jgi:predicted patatin/cPLA2 family phospholipase
LLRKWLDIVIPDSVRTEDLQDLHIAITPTFKSPKLVSNFEDKNDLIDAIMASCHVPVFLDGRPFTEYKGEQVLDGSFWYFVTKDRYTGKQTLIIIIINNNNNYY